MKRLLLSIALIAVTLFTAGGAIARIDDGLVVYLTFDSVKGNRILDESGNDLDAKIVGKTDFVQGRFGNGIRITGDTEDCVNIPNADALEIDGEITMSAWLYRESWTESSVLWFDKGTQPPMTNPGYGMAIFDTHALGGGAPNESAWVATLLGADATKQHFIVNGWLRNGTWHHIAGTCDKSGDVNIYLDGEKIFDEPLQAAFAGANDEDLRIGCAMDRPDYAFRNGAIDEVALWNRALTEAEILTLSRGKVLAVSPDGKVSTTWGNIKERTMHR